MDRYGQRFELMDVKQNGWPAPLAQRGNPSL